MSIDDQSGVFDPDVAAIITMDERLVGLELRDASAVHALVAQAPVFDRLKSIPQGRLA